MKKENLGLRVCWLMVLRPIVLLEHPRWALKKGKGTDVRGEARRRMLGMNNCLPAYVQNCVALSGLASPRLSLTLGIALQGKFGNVQLVQYKEPLCCGSQDPLKVLQEKERR